MVYLPCWEKLIYKRLFLSLFVCLFSFSSLFILIDYAGHTRLFSHLSGTSFLSSFFIYYIGVLLERANILIPFALLLTMMQVLQTLKAKREMVILQCAGISLKRITRSFFVLTTVIFCLFMLHSIYVLPLAYRYQRKTIDAQTMHKLKEKKIPQVHYIALKDNSFLFYEGIKPEKQQLIAPIWIENKDRMHQMDSLSYGTEHPIGKNVQLLISDKEKGFLLADTSTEKIYPELLLNQAMIHDTLKPDEERSTKELLKKLGHHDKISEQYATILSVLFYRFITPTFTLVALILPLALTLREKQSPLLLRYLIAVFCLAFCYLILDAGWLLAKRQVIHPFNAIIAPQCLFLFLLSIPLWRIQWN